MNKRCDSCKHGHKGDGITLFKTDIICMKDSSEYCAEFVAKDGCCKYWEKV